MRIIRALYKSATNGEPVKIDDFEKEERPTMEHEIHKGPVDKPKLVRAAAPSRRN